MPDLPEDLTSGHPSGRLRPAPTPGEDLATGSPDRDLPISAVFPTGAVIPSDTVTYGPDIPTDADFKLLGHLEGKRVLELGCGAGHAAVALARQGAHVIVVDPSPRRLERVRAVCEREEVRVELHQSDLAELAFVRADTIDLVLSVYALASVPDLDRVFRQVHRVLRTGSPLVFSLPHPAFRVAEGGSYFEHTPVPWNTRDASGAELPRTISEVFVSLTRANFRVDNLLEPEPIEGPRSSFWKPTMARVPATLLIRARKEGI
jgi:SAM-dependent methyltransferase